MGQGLPDNYKSYDQLKKKEKIDRDYRIRCKNRKTNKVIIAIHGGNIEPGTAEIAESIAGEKHSFYIFEGIKPVGNNILHIDSTSFDEPCGICMVEKSIKVLSIHGCRDETWIVYLGGRDKELREKILNELNKAGLTASDRKHSNLNGLSAENICNRGANSKGVQMEISAGLRKKMFKGLETNDGNPRTDLFYHFVNTVREAFD